MRAADVSGRTRATMNRPRRPKNQNVAAGLSTSKLARIATMYEAVGLDDLAKQIRAALDQAAAIAADSSTARAQLAATRDDLARQVAAGKVTADAAAVELRKAEGQNVGGLGDQLAADAQRVLRRDLVDQLYELGDALLLPLDERVGAAAETIRDRAPACLTVTADTIRSAPPAQIAAWQEMHEAVETIWNAWALATRLRHAGLVHDLAGPGIVHDLWRWQDYLAYVALSAEHRQHPHGPLVGAILDGAAPRVLAAHEVVALHLEAR